MSYTEQLAINGGPKVRNRPFPDRGLLGEEEKEAVIALFDEAIATGIAIGYLGPEEEAYCSEFASFMGGGYADAVNSGTTAVYVALRALDLEPFTEVIVSPITDPGGMMPIALLNCIPVIADSAPGKYNTDAEQIEKLITPLTSAILVAHIGGEPLNIEAIVALGKKYGIPVVEDCAQAHGASINGKLVGSFGDIAAFSTMFGKHHCTGGQGGVVFTRQEALYWRARQASDRGKPFGLPEGSTNAIASLNFNLNDLAAAIGREQLKKLPIIVQKRRALAAKLSERLSGLQSIIIPPQIEGAESSYWWWRLEVNTEQISCDKDTYCRALSAEGLPINPSYRAMPHLMDWFQQQNVFGTSGYPWKAPAYKGNADREFQCPNAMAATSVQFNLYITESWGEQEIADTLAAFEKVDLAYKK
ncbi:DegT/DnrJ/EryC1/StrS family aminotransferase [Paenibacillus eucommiae]|uniref:dTDP-4-amino-4,6-dideoxygalactose transaminase n=1 Tax=Paenibacillus eucommiae TaxID=1355755 RepID=A0ABS4IM80_9BACL|nr:DegT/DnrJ/EryC1/StrS family aminotransferase [Paenibacillus eucommiae]MBP1988625.1 dTDP-4-amino-4,6-dideoxygalactose transaminase [Paenibacillus eucommiae]